MWNIVYSDMSSSVASTDIVGLHYQGVFRLKQFYIHANRIYGNTLRNDCRNYTLSQRQEISSSKAIYRIHVPMYQRSRFQLSICRCKHDYYNHKI